jgi:peptide subunit release factor 1 (eRF1)
MMHSDEQDDLKEMAKAAAAAIQITAQCTTCGISYTENFPWFKENEFNCPECGGAIDEQPFVDFANQAFERLKALKKNRDN